MRPPFFALLAPLFLLAVSAFGSPFTLGPTTKSVVLAPGFHHADISLPIVPSGGGFTYNQVTVTSDASWVTPQVDSAGQKVVLKFTTAALSNPSYTATIRATHGGNTAMVSVNASSSALNVFKLIDDPYRSRMYGLHFSGVQAGCVLVIDPLTGSAISSITVGKRPTGMAISNDGSELFVINSVDKTISVIDLQTLTVTQTLMLPVFGTWGDGSETTANIQVGAGNILYYTDTSWAPVLHVFNRGTGQVIQSVVIASGSFGFGDFALNLGKTQLFGWAQYGWSAGSSGSYLARFDVSGTGTLTPRETSSGTINLSRDPLETPVLVAHGDGKVFAKTVAVPTENFTSVIRSFPTDVYSISPGGEIAVTESAIFQQSTGNRLLTLPVTTSIHAISSDYARLVYFNPGTRQIGTVDLFTQIGNVVLERVLSPAHQSMVLQPETLSWSSQAGASSYQIYFGTSSAQVDAATPVSPLYLGSSLYPTIAAPGGLTPGTTYHWRVDTVIGSQISKGSVYSFTVSPVSTSVSKVVTSTVQSHADHRVKVQFDSATPGQSWSAVADQPWVTFTSSTGSTPGELELRLNAGSLAVGTHQAVITLSGTSGTLLSLPVQFTVAPLKITHLKSQPSSSLIYGISEDTATLGAKAYLVEMDATTESILRVVPAGISVTDLAIHEADNRIYVPNWKIGDLLAFNKTTLALERTYAFSAFQGTGYGMNDVYRVAAGKSGRLVVEEQDQWIDISIFDTVNGAKKGKIGLREGGGAFESTGQFYYHGENNSSGAQLYKLDVTGDVFTTLVKSRVIGYGSRVVVVSENGQAVFWNGSHFNANLVEQGTLADQIYSTTGEGVLAFGEAKIYDTASRQQVLTMPVSTRVSAYNTTTSKLVVQNGTRLRFYPLELPITLPAPVLSGGESTAITINSLPVKWTEDSLEMGFNLQYRPVGDGNWTNASPSPVANQTSATLTGLAMNTPYEIRIQATSPAASSPWSNTIVMRTVDLPAPTIFLSQAYVSGLGLQLTWTSTNSPASIIVERATNAAGPWTPIATLAGNAANYKDNNAQTDVVYYYRVQAIRGSISVYSGVENTMLPSPTLFVATPYELNESLRIVASNSNSAFTTVLQRSLGQSGIWEDLTTFKASSLTYTDTLPDPNVTVHYRLKALPETLTSKLSNVATITMPPASAPVTPANFAFSSISPSAIGLVWNDVRNETGYRLERRAASVLLWSPLATLDANVTAYTDATPTAGVSYYYRLKAFNAEGESPAALSVLVTARELPVALEDDFDPSRDAEQWTYSSVTVSTNGGSGFNGTKSLWFGHSGARLTQTRAVDTSGGGIIEFSFRAGNSLQDGTTYWDNSESGEEVILEYSKDGNTWTTLQTLNTVYPSHSAWTNFEIAMPMQACSPTSVFRWSQRSHSGSTFDTWALDNVRIRSASSDTLKINTQPVPQLVMDGSAASFSVSVSQPSATFQWFKDTTPIPGATQPSYSVAAARPSHSGRYLCQIQYGQIILETESVPLAVFRNTGIAGPIDVPLGGTFGLGLEVHPPELASDLTFSWTRSPEANLAGIGTVSGAETPVLSVTGATSAAQSTYYCRVTYQTDYALNAGPFPVRLQQPPFIFPIADAEVVSGSPVDIAVVTTDTTAVIRVSGLPKGLYYDATARRIRGSTTLGKIHTIYIDAANAYGAAPSVRFLLDVVAFPQGFAGNYRGVFLETDQAFDHGGQVTCQITNKGAVSGSVLVRGKSYRFVSTASADPDGSWARVQAPFKDQDGNPLVVGMEILAGADLHGAYVGLKMGSTIQVLTEGNIVRNEWTAANLAPGAGLINAGLFPDDLGTFPDPDAPQGTGFLTLTLSPRGLVTCKGRLADGQLVTGSTHMGPGGHIPVYVNLYRGTGAFVSLVSYESQLATGTAYWSKDDQGNASKDRIHKNGFARHALTVEGGRYERPAVNTPLLPSMLGLPSQAVLSLTDAGLNEAIFQSINFNGKHQALLPRALELNPHSLTLSLNATTGVFTGNFRLEDANPLKPAVMLRRIVTFHGCLLPTSDRGCGYFLLPELPSTKVSGSSLSNTPTWSGRLDLTPAGND